MASEFVKSATTSVKAEKTQSDIIAMLGRYGATGFGFRRRGSVVEVTFHLPRKGAEDQTVRIPVDTGIVLAKLTRMRTSTKQNVPDAAQAERTAWRALYYWIEASLLAVTLGAQSMEEAFFAHLLVTTDDGQQGRLVEYVATLGSASGGVLPGSHRLLGGGSRPSLKEGSEE